MLKFFGDEAGISVKERICAVAGLVGTEKAWVKFDRDWRKVLTAAGIPYFHAVDCERGKNDFYGLDVSKRGRIVDNLVGVIVNSGVTPYSYGLVKPHFEQWNHVDRDYFTLGHPDNPYFMVLGSTFTFVAAYADRFPKGEQIHFVFEQQDEFESHARDIFEIFKNYPIWPRSPRLGKLCFEKEKDKYPGIEAADLLAYETYRHLDNKHFRPLLRDEWKARTAMKVLHRKFENGQHAKYFDGPTMAEMSRVRSEWVYG